jgi:hypothetical protein
LDAHPGQVIVSKMFIFCFSKPGLKNNRQWQKPFWATSLSRVGHGQTISLSGSGGNCCLHGHIYLRYKRKLLVINVSTSVSQFPFALSTYPFRFAILSTRCRFLVCASFAMFYYIRHQLSCQRCIDTLSILTTLRMYATVSLP